jgi:hypothetical protein
MGRIARCSILLVLAHLILLDHIYFWAAMKLLFATEVTEDTEFFLISSSPGDNSLS